MSHEAKGHFEYLEEKRVEVCKNKRPFFSRKEARECRTVVKQKLRKKQRVYKCPVIKTLGEHFHLATKKGE